MQQYQLITISSQNENEIEATGKISCMPEIIVKLETQFQGDFLEIRDIITRNRKHYPNSIFPSITLD